MAKYRPRLSKDEFIVSFLSRRDVSLGDAKELGKLLGCEYAGEWPNKSGANAYIFRASEGIGLDEAMARFKKLQEFLVDWVDTLDVRWEARYNNLEAEVTRMINDVDYETDAKDYKKQIDKIVEQLYKVK